MSNDKLDHGTIRVGDAKAKAGQYPVILESRGTRLGDGYIGERDGTFYFTPSTRKGGRKPMELKPGMNMHFFDPNGKLPYKKFRLV